MAQPEKTVFLTAAEMRGVERAAMAAGAVTGLQLMERAGRGVVTAIHRRWPGLAAMPGRAVVLCGPGNNGGDGYVVARLLAGRGWSVRVFALAAPATPDARAMAALWTGGVAPLAALTEADLRGAALTVDALFGTGLGRDLAPEAAQALALAGAAGVPLVAVDVLSGLCADSGRLRVAGAAPGGAAALTVTFETRKPGHVLAEGGGLSGPVEVVPLGLGPWRAGLGVAETAAPPPKAGGHKYDHGHALVLAGGPGRGGAARLAARAALRIGAGLVTLACPAAALAENAARLDAVMLREAGTGADLAAILQDRRIGALCLGPGMGVDRGDLVAAALASGRATVLDADALTVLAGDPALRARLGPQVVLTPHDGEFARLFPDLAATLATPPFSRLDAARAAAARLGVVVLLKGPATVIAAPDGRAAINDATGPRAVPWLATAGAGDVLAGLIAGLLVRGLAPFDAACAGAWAHTAAARRFGPGLIAEDLPEVMPAVLRDLGG